jgi:hypothetical protein
VLFLSSGINALRECACPRLLRLLRFINRQASVLPRGIAAEQGRDVGDIFAFECLRRTGA